MRIVEEANTVSVSEVAFGDVFRRDGTYHMKCYALPGMRGFIVVNLSNGVSEVWGDHVNVTPVEGEFFIGKGA